MTARHRRRHGLHPLDAIRASRPLLASQAQSILIRVHDAFAHLRGGGNDQDMFDRIAVCIDLGIVRAKQMGNGEIGVALFMAADRALKEAARIRSDHGRYGFTGQGVETLKEAIDLYADILCASSPRQMERARNEVLAAHLAPTNQPLSRARAHLACNNQE